MSEKPPVEVIRAVPSDRSWWDPGLIIRAVNVEPFTVDYTAGPAVQLVPADPRRLLLVITGQDPALINVKLSLEPDVDSAVIAIAAGSNANRFSLFEWPGIVQRAWFLKSPSTFKLKGYCVVRP